MAEIISLKQVRKQKARSDKDTLATENRLKFGRTKHEKQIDKARTELAQKHVDAHKREE